MQLQERKRFKIPRQIDSSVHLWRFIRVKDLFIMIPPILFSIMLFRWIIPFLPFNIRFLISALPSVLVACLIFVRPVRERPNLKLIDLLVIRWKFSKRQKIYYFKKKSLSRGEKLG